MYVPQPPLSELLHDGKQHKTVTPFTSLVCVEITFSSFLTPEVLHHQLSVKCLLKFPDTTLDVPSY
jgi:hypothetical protein